MAKYQTTLEKPQADIVLPSGGIVTPDELGTLCETMVRKSYMDAHHDFERVFSEFKKGEDLYNIIVGKKPMQGVQKFVAAVAVCPAEATFVRMQINNPLLAFDEELDFMARQQVELKLLRTDFTNPQGKDIKIPLIDFTQGPRIPPLSDTQLQALCIIWVELDKSESIIQKMFMDKHGPSPDTKPS